MVLTESILLEKRLDILNDYIRESYELDDELEDSIGYLEEATTNRDVLSKYKNKMHESKNYFKAGKKAFKAKQFKEAKENFNKALKTLDELDKYVRNIDDMSNASNILGNILGFILTYGIYIAIAVITIALVVKNLKQYRSDTHEVLNKLNFVKDEHGKLNAKLAAEKRDLRVEEKLFIKLLDKDEYYTLALDKINTKLFNIKNDVYICGYLAAAAALMVKGINNTKKILAGGSIEGKSNLLREQIIVNIAKMKETIKCYITLCDQAAKLSK